MPFAPGSLMSIEVRQDMIADTAGQRHWAKLISAALMAAVYPG
jgi:predicted N-formylglutamate amidohydrolase